MGGELAHCAGGWWVLVMVVAVSLRMVVTAVGPMTPSWREQEVHVSPHRDHSNSEVLSPTLLQELRTITDLVLRLQNQGR